MSLTVSEQIESTQPHRVSDLLLEASRQLQEQGIPRSRLDPRVLVLATTPVSELRRVQDEVFGRALDAEHSRHSNMTQAQKTEALAERRVSNRLDETIDRLANRGRSRTAAGVLVVGMAAGLAATYGVGRIKYDSRRATHDPVPANAMFNGNTLVWDSSILPGDTGKNIPVIGFILRNIPGVPDFGGPSKIKYTAQVPETVTVPDVQVRQNVSLNNALNPLAPDLQLTGSEYPADRQAAKELLDKVDPKTFTDKTVSVIGSVSDDLRDEVGQYDPEQQQLADARANVAAQALKDEAAARGIKLGEFSVTGIEAVLEPDQIAKLANLANENGLSSHDLIKAYNEGQPVSEEAQAFLDETLAARRGAEFILSGATKTTKMVDKTVWKDKPAQDIWDDIAGEEPFAMGAAVPLIYGGIYTMSRGRRRQVRRYARRMAKKAGFKF